MKNLLRLILAVALPSTALIVSGNEPVPDNRIRLQPLPARIYKTRDSGSERTESWVLWLLMEAGTVRDLKVQGAKILLLSGPQLVRTTSYDAEGVRALTITPPSRLSCWPSFRHPRRFSGRRPFAFAAPRPPRQRLMG